MIAVGYDGSDSSAAALTWAGGEAGRRDTQLRILHAINVPALVVGTGSGAVSGEPLVQNGEDLLAKGEKLVRELGVADVVTRLCHATPAGALVEESRSAELVVVGSRGRGEVVAGLLGSVAYAVTAHASCPVVIVRSGHDGALDATHPVVVGADGSEQAARAVTVAASLAEKAGAALRIVGAWTVPTVQGGGYGGYWVWPDSTVGAQTDEEVARACIDGLATDVSARHPGLAVTTDVVEGNPAEVVCRAGENAGLVVVGSRGRGGFAGLLLGSVSHHVMHAASVPVMVVR